MTNDPAEQSPQFAVGARLQAVRQAHGLSQRELARRANMTNGSLSLIEQGKVSPSLGSLEKILQAIPLSLPEFFAEAAKMPVVCSTANWTLIHEGSARMRVMPLQNGGDWVECELSAQCCEASGTILGNKRGFTAGMVLEGQMELRLDGVCHALSPGDGFQIAGHRNRQFANPNDVSCRFIVFMQN